MTGLNPKHSTEAQPEAQPERDGRTRTDLTSSAMLSLYHSLLERLYLFYNYIYYIFFLLFFTVERRLKHILHLSSSYDRAPVVDAVHGTKVKIEKVLYEGTCTRVPFQGVGCRGSGGTPHGDGPLEDVRVILDRRHGEGVGVPRASLRPRPLEHLQVAALRRGGARLGVPGAAGRSGPSQDGQGAAHGGKGAHHVPRKTAPTGLGPSGRVLPSYQTPRRKVKMLLSRVQLIDEPIVPVSSLFIHTERGTRET